MECPYVYYFQLSHLIGSLQAQRGLTAVFISSNQTNLESAQKLSIANSKTLTEIVDLSNWFELHIPKQQVTFKNKDGLLNHIKEFNIDVFTTKTVSLEESIYFYTQINQAILDLMAVRISVPEHDRILVALDALLRAADAVGIQRALGAAYWSNCRFPDGNILWFTNLRSENQTYLEQLFRYHEASVHAYNRGLRELDPLEALLKSYSANMSNPEYAQTCLKIPLQERYDISLLYFDNMTTYMGLLSNVRQSLVNKLLEEIDKTMNKANVEVRNNSLHRLIKVSLAYLV